MITKVFISEFKGQPIFEVHSVDAEGKPKFDRPLVSFGVAKARAIKAHLPELDEFIKENTKTE